MTTIRELVKQKRDKQAEAQAATSPHRTLPDDGTAPPFSLLTDRELARLIGTSRSSIWRYVSMGLVPPPIRIGGSSRWRSDEVMAFIERLTAERDAEVA